MKKIMVLLLVLAMAGLSQAGIVNGDIVLVDFAAAGDAADFIVVRDDTASVDSPGLGIAQNAAKGVGATPSGGVEAVGVSGVNGSNDLAALYAPGGSAAAGAIAFGVNDTLMTSIAFKTLHVDEAATPRLGIASFGETATATTNWTNMDIPGGKDVIGGTTGGNHASGIAVNLATGGNKTFNIVNVIGGGGRESTEDAGGPYDLVNDTWYEFILEITKSATLNEFDVNVTLNLLNADGTVLDSQIGSIAQTVSNAGLYADSDVISGFTIVHDGEPDSVTNEYDNFAVSVVPEPATMVLLGLGSLVLARRKK